jgi:hypothetical protein
MPLGLKVRSGQSIAVRRGDRVVRLWPRRDGERCTLSWSGPPGVTVQPVAAGVYRLDDGDGEPLEVRLRRYRGAGTGRVLTIFAGERSRWEVTRE